MNIVDQIHWISSELKQHGLRNQNLLEEYTDHYLSTYEYQLILGLDPREAQGHVRKLMRAQDFKKLNQQYFFLNYKNQIMLSTLIITFITFFLVNNATQDFSIVDPPSICPVQSCNVKSVSDFGMRIHPINQKKQMHKGMDFKMPSGSQIVATADGVVIKTAKWNSGYGYHVIIDHGDGFETLYAHMQEISVKMDQEVHQGEVIGLVGSTGMSSSPHLHYEVRKDGSAVNPKTYIKS